VNPEQPDYLQGLNPEQLSAVLHEGGNLLILAGAGSGKTRVITTKIAWLIRERGFAPESILAVTFTNKAAAEMKERACRIEPACERANLRTFHSFGAWLLRRNADLAGIDKNFTIYDDDDSAALVRAALPSLARPEATRLAHAIARAKDYSLDPDSPDLGAFKGFSDFRRCYAEYQQRLRATGNVDFGDLINLPTRLLEENEAVRRRLHDRFRVILVDEYQDSNVAQFRLLKALAGPEAYVCVVGDDDQSIYRFRGAEVQNILSFPDIFPNTATIRLERNYRSYQSILSIATSVVEKNEGRLGKVLRAERTGGGKPQLAVLANQNEEAAYCIRIIDKHLRNGGSFSDVAILYRTNAQSLAFERAFPPAGLPYRLVGALRFYEREEVKDILAFLALVSNRRDEIAFRRIINKPVRGIGDSSVELIIEEAFAQNQDFVSAAAVVKMKTAKGRAGAAAFKAFIDDLSARFEQNLESLARLVEHCAKESGLLEYHRGQDEIAGSQKVSNIDELINAASDYPATRDGLSAFLEAVELDRAMASGEVLQDAVTLITMHNTKGLEFPVVIITGMEQGLFPRDNEEGEELEEQRRLLYVAMTRAKNELYLTYCRNRLFRGRIMDYPPSRFLAELPADSYETTGGKLSLAVSAAMATWKRGMNVYHDDHGSGQILAVKDAGEAGVCLVVRFETGRQLQFFPKYTSKLEVLKNNDF